MAVAAFDRALDRQRLAFGLERWDDAPDEIRERFPREAAGRVSTDAMQAWWRFLAHRRAWSHRCASEVAQAGRALRRGDEGRAHALLQATLIRAATGLRELQPLRPDEPVPSQARRRTAPRESRTGTSGTTG